MSYDIYLLGKECPTCKRRGGEPESMNPTYNLTPIFDLALTGEPLPNADVGEGAVVLLGHKTDRPRGLRLLSGRVARETMADINRALDRLADPEMRPAFVALEPPNKWGDLDSAIWVMRKLREHAEKYPDNVWEIH
jgi:hypothetical protein